MSRNQLNLDDTKDAAVILNAFSTVLGDRSLDIGLSEDEASALQADQKRLHRVLIELMTVVAGMGNEPQRLVAQLRRFNDTVLVQTPGPELSKTAETDNVQMWRLAGALPILTKSKLDVVSAILNDDREIIRVDPESVMDVIALYAAILLQNSSPAIRESLAQGIRVFVAPNAMTAATARYMAWQTPQKVGAGIEAQLNQYRSTTEELKAAQHQAQEGVKSLKQELEVEQKVAQTQLDSLTEALRESRENADSVAEQIGAFKDRVATAEKEVEGFKAAFKEGAGLEEARTLWRSRARSAQAAFIMSSLLLIVFLFGIPLGIWTFAGDVVRFVQTVEAGQPIPENALRRMLRDQMSGGDRTRVYIGDETVGPGVRAGETNHGPNVRAGGTNPGENPGDGDGIGLGNNPDDDRGSLGNNLGVTAAIGEDVASNRIDGIDVARGRDQSVDLAVNRGGSTEPGGNLLIVQAVPGSGGGGHQFTQPGPATGGGDRGPVRRDFGPTTRSDSNQTPLTGEGTSGERNLGTNPSNQRNLGNNPGGTVSDNPVTLTLVLLNRLVLLLFPVAMVIWAIRILVRFNLRSLLLMDDARQRMTMLDTYLFMLSRSAADTSDRGAVLEALFRRPPGHGADTVNPPDFVDLLNVRAPVGGKSGTS